jgi:molybdopterin synthase sulfur carrier subunit
MIKVLFFASLRERLGVREWIVENCEGINTLNQLADHIRANKGDAWANILSQENIVKAVNQVAVDGDCELKDGDEVAFYPPVTGG